ncbi:MAG: YdaS family helix-turn-helix protein [Candidatus Contendobacter sp.]|nr:YdaS family helix-turn-helix protein [Candidatus Contendobacter sp.]MDG4556036.1 YdaS family helix-turn-helix protein [Candidatus Contendobacter sp.]
MNLTDFFKAHGTAHIAEIAAQANTSLGYLRGCLYGQRRMSADLAIWLEHVTSGELTARELRPDLPWPASAKEAA